MSLAERKKQREWNNTFREKQRREKLEAAEKIIADEQAAEVARRAALAQPQKDDAISDIFRTAPWSLSNPNVIAQCIATGRDRAFVLGVAPSVTYWQEGSDDPHISDELGGRSEILTFKELRALYQFTAAGLKVLGAEISFEQWLDLRDKARKDLWWLATEVLRIPLLPFHLDLCERFYPRLNADGMFDKNYSIAQMQAAISQQVPVNTFLLHDPRGFRKTAQTSAFVLQFMLNFTDCRVFDISGTDDLAAGFLRIMKGYLGHEDGAEMSTLQLLFPEYTLRGQDATSESAITLPCRRFFQKDFSFETFGVMAAASGRHCDLFVGDDIVQDTSATSETIREKLLHKADTLSSNVPDSHAIRLWLGTRYHAEDYYSGMINIWEQDPTSMVYFTFSSFVPKEEFKDVPITELINDPTPDRVELRWPDKAGNPTKTWKELRNKARKNLADFMFQQMNMAPTFDDPDAKLAFDLDKLTNLFVDPKMFPQDGDEYLTVDIAWEQTQRADYSVLVAGRLGKALSSSDLQSVYFDEIDARRRRSSELSLAIVEMSMRHNFKSVIVEKIGGAEAVMDEARRLAAVRGFQLPFIWMAPVILTTKAKWRRIKTLETEMTNSRIWFSNKIDPTQIALTLDQFTKYTGKRSGTRHDDIPDTIALFWQHVVPKEEKDGRSQQERNAAIEQAEAAEAMRRQYGQIFGGPNSMYGVSQPTPQEDANSDPMKNWCWPKNTDKDKKKPLSFSYMREKPVR
jgi:hypothetical protein